MVLDGPLGLIRAAFRASGALLALLVPGHLALGGLHRCLFDLVTYAGHVGLPSLRCAILSFYEVVSVFCSIFLRRVTRSLLSSSYSPTLFSSASERPSSRSETSPTFISS